MSQYCSGLIAIVLHEQPWSLIWSFHECFTVFVAIQDTFFLGKQRPTHKTITPQHVGTGGWGIRVVGRKTMENLGQHTKQHTNNQKKQKRSKPTHEHRTNFFLPVVCGLFSLIIFDFWYFLVTSLLWSLYGVYESQHLYMYIYVYVSYTCIYGNGEDSINCGQSRCDWSHSIGLPRLQDEANIVSPWSESIA